MDRLPAELISQICSQLCRHCRSPDALPHADTAGVRLSKSSLARLARTSKYICAIAQPYVFHYYATGNMTRIVISEDTWCPQDLTNPDQWQPSGHGNDRLPSFLRTMIQRPDLAAHVTALQLVSSTNTDDLSDGDMDLIASATQRPEQHVDDISHTSAAFRMLRQASVELEVIPYNVFHPGYSAWRLAKTGYNLHVPEGYKIPADAIHHTLEQLAILLCPNVKTLAFGSRFEILPSTMPVMTEGGIALGHFWSVILSSKRRFPSLKKLALLSDSRGFRFDQDQMVLSSMQNVETVYGTHLSYPGEQRERISPMIWVVTPPVSVRKLVVSGIGPESLEFLVSSCRNLADLEYRHHGYSGRRVQGPEILRAIDSARFRLRRLVLVGMAQGDPMGYLFSDSEGIGSLQEFANLQELVINHNELACSGPWGRRTRTDLAKLLPRSIERLHILYVWRSDGLVWDLEHLAQVAAREAPNLRSVQISHMDIGFDDDPHYDPSDWFPVDERDHERVQKLLAAINVSMTWDRIKFKMPKAETAPGETAPAASGTYLSTPYCFWEVPDAGHIV